MTTGGTHYVICGVDGNGQEKTVTIQTDSEDEALALARERGIFPTNVLRQQLRTVPPPPPQSQREPPPSRPFAFCWGSFALFTGLGMLVSFIGCYDTTVPTGGGDRVYNTGLMQNQQIGVMIGMGLFALGVYLLVADKRTSQSRQNAGG